MVWVNSVFECWYRQWNTISILWKVMTHDCSTFEYKGNFLIVFLILFSSIFYICCDPFLKNKQQPLSDRSILVCAGMLRVRATGRGHHYVILDRLEEMLKRIGRECAGAAGRIQSFRRIFGLKPVETSRGEICHLYLRGFHFEQSVFCVWIQHDSTINRMPRYAKTWHARYIRIDGQVPKDMRQAGHTGSWDGQSETHWIGQLTQLKWRDCGEKWRKDSKLISNLMQFWLFILFKSPSKVL